MYCEDGKGRGERASEGGGDGAGERIYSDFCSETFARHDGGGRAVLGIGDRIHLCEAVDEQQQYADLDRRGRCFSTYCRLCRRYEDCPLGICDASLGLRFVN